MAPSHGLPVPHIRRTRPRARSRARYQSVGRVTKRPVCEHFARSMGNGPLRGPAYRRLMMLQPCSRADSFRVSSGSTATGWVTFDSSGKSFKESL
jgi:hypothetical protein